MANEKHDHWSLLREAAEHMKAVAKDRGLCPDCVLCDRGIDITTRIDAALAEHEAVPSSEERADSATPVVEWEQSHWMTYFNGFRIQVYPSRLDLGWWEFLVERDPHDPNERLIGQATSKQAAMRGGIQAVKEWK